ADLFFGPRHLVVYHAGDAQALRAGVASIASAAGAIAAPLRPDTSAAPRFREPREPLTLCAEGVTVQLGRRTVLRNLNLTVRGGETAAIVGRNGVGKTTLLRALGGLVPYDGRIDGNGERADLGLVFQNADLQLFNASVRDEILYRVDNPDMALYEHLLDVLGLTRYENTPPLLLSEGEKKRVALATVLLRQPRHGVLLDEPSLGQDLQIADLQLFNASVRDEILYRVDNPDMALYEHLLDVLGLTRYENTPPLLLSEGEKKRVALATVLLRQPRHGVLLDEPSLGQDL